MSYILKDRGYEFDIFYDLSLNKFLSLLNVIVLFNRNKKPSQEFPMRASMFPNN